MNGLANSVGRMGKHRVEFERVIVVPLSGAGVASQYTDYEQFTASGAAMRRPALDENDAAGMSSRSRLVTVTS